MNRRWNRRQLAGYLYGTAARDTYYTPSETTRVLLAHDPPPHGCVLDPCAGDGAILREARALGYVCAAVEVREDMRDELVDACGDDAAVLIGDWLNISRHYDWRARLSPHGGLSIVTNPPYSIGVDIARATLAIGADYVALLLSCNVIGSGTWRGLWRDHPPSRLRPVRRPSFRADGRTSHAEYCWFIWSRGEGPINIRPI